LNRTVDQTMKQFYKTEEEFTRLHTRLKQINCPHCHRIGFLILHGYLHGYADTKVSHRIIRGRRIFCSNRKKRCGCGRTFSLLASNVIKHFMISAHTLWRFLEKFKDGLSIADAFRKSGSNMRISSAYRLFNRFRFNQPGIRSFLSRISPPPQLQQVKDPLIQTIVHLGAAFNVFPVAAFQHAFQAPFLQRL